MIIKRSVLKISVVIGYVTTNFRLGCGQAEEAATSEQFGFEGIRRGRTVRLLLKAAMK